MPLLTVTRFLFSLISLAILGAAGYLIWSWFDGDVIRAADGALVREREDWRLWAGLALLAWSLLGRLIVVPLIAKPDRIERPFVRSAGRTIQGEDGALYIEEHGDPQSPPIVLTHGQALDATIWADVTAALAQRLRVITWDLPGLGKSARPRDFGPAAAARNLRTVMGETRATRAVLVGHSFGGMTIQDLAQSDPDFFGRYVAGIVLLNTTYTNPLKTMVLGSLFKALQKPVLEPGAYVTAWLEPLVWLNMWQSYLSGWGHLANRIAFDGEVTRRVLEHVTLLSTRNRPGAISRRNVAMFHWRGLGNDALSVPTLIVAGGKDIVTKCEASEEIARRVGRPTLHVVEPANHMGPYEQTDAYVEAIVRFVETLSDPSPELTDEDEVLRPATRNGGATPSIRDAR